MCIFATEIDASNIINRTLVIISENTEREEAIKLFTSESILHNKTDKFQKGLPIRYI